MIAKRKYRSSSVNVSVDVDISDVLSEMDDADILDEAESRGIGHKTFATGEKDEHGFPKMRHEPLTRGEADAIWESAEKAKAERNARMPDEQSAIKALFDAWYRLKDFNWNDPSYCPKDGSRFNILELGSTGIHTGYYQGEWPDGHWWVEADYDLWPSRPALFKLFPEDQAKCDQQMKEGAKRYRASVGLDWKISDETKAAIEEIEGNSRRAMANAHNIIAGESK